MCNTSMDEPVCSCCAVNVSRGHRSRCVLCEQRSQVAVCVVSVV